ncbi:sorbosone dehydrogenase family protein [Sphingomonas sp.]|uniref:PQQ-dependent sugar dehydrogenase n=1 Tax=Sphingomonas sp. TaxID=28214 RepID=UPI00286E8D5B|nr:sorbosone dehydrogenase family protein [Sphingomonas sp.]
MTDPHRFALILALALTACGEKAEQDFSASTGPNPTLGEPRKSLIPTVKIADAQGWPAGAAPTAAAGLAVNQFAGDLAHPRWLHVLPNGDVLVALSDSPGTDKTGGLIKGAIQARIMNKAGSGRGSPDLIVLLRDRDGNGVAETRTTLLEGLKSPFGMALVGEELFVANADALIAFPFRPGVTKLTARPRLVTALPSGYNRHWTKSLTVSPDGKYLFVGVGSNSNAGENGLEMEKGRAAIWVVEPNTGAYRIFASGLRNPVGLAFNPASGALWTVVNERDELGSDLVPDYLTSVRDGGFYGWPWSYYGNRVDTRVNPPRPDMMAKAIVPDYALGNHVAPLGLAFSADAKLGPRFATGAFIGEHGSWNRNPPSGYKVSFVPFAGGRPSGRPVDVLTGFRVGDVARGRPVGVEIARDGALLVADDVGGKVWRVTATLPRGAATR